MNRGGNGFGEVGRSDFRLPLQTALFWVIMQFVITHCIITQKSEILK